MNWKPIAVAGLLGAALVAAPFADAEARCRANPFCWPFIAGAAVVTGAAVVATAPLRAVAPPYYAPGYAYPGYGYPYSYAPAPGYGYYAQPPAAYSPTYSYGN